MDADRIISQTLQEEDVEFEASLRPSQFRDFIGQQKIKENLGVYIEAAQKAENEENVRDSVCHESLLRQ